MSASEELRSLMGRRLFKFIALALIPVCVAKGTVDHKFIIRDPCEWSVRGFPLYAVSKRNSCV